MTAAAKEAKTGTHWRRIIALTLFAGLMLAALALANSGRAAIETPPPPSVWSDKADYAPGEQVTLSGANWAPGESVHIRVNDDAGETWRRDVDVTADENGAISDQFNLPDWFVAQYSVTATGASSGTATWTFTDSQPTTITVSPSSASVAQGGTANYTATVTTSTQGNANLCSVTLAAVGLPAGATATFSPNPRTVGQNTSASSSFSITTSSTTPTGSFPFTVTGSNGGGCQGNGATPGPATLVVTSANQAPVADAQPVITNEDTAKTITLTGTDADGNSLTFAIGTGPSHGSLGSIGAVTCTGTAPKSCSADVTYTPTLNYNGSDSFTFKVNDGTVDSAAATVSITVNAINDAPSCSAVSLTTDEDTPGDADPSCTDVDSASLTYAIVAAASHGTASIVAGKLHYVPNANYNGSDSFTYKANDGAADSNVATVSVTITAVNDAPTCSNGSATTPEDTAKDVTLSCADVDGDSLTYSIVSGPAHGSLSGTGASRTYTPAPNYNGSDSFTFKANDGAADSNVATVSVTITAVNDDPTVTTDHASVTVNEGQTAHNTGTFGDVDGDTVTLSASVGTVVKNLDGTWSWSFGTTDGPGDSQTVTISAGDGNGGSASTTFSLTVNNVAPSVTAAAAQSSNEGSSNSFSLGSFTDPGPDGPWSVDVDWGDGSTHTTFTKSSPGSLGSQDHTYADGPDDYTVTVKVTEAGTGTAPSGQATFAVHVNNVAPTVTFANDNDTLVNEGTTHSYSFTVTDPGDDDFTVLAFDCGTYGTVDEDSLTTDVFGGSFDCTFPDGPADTNVHVKVEDSDHASDTDSEVIQVVHVANVAPTVEVFGDASANEGSTHTYTYTVSDPGDDPNPTINEDCGLNGTRTDTPAPNSFDCTFPDGPASSTVKVTADDGDPSNNIGSAQIVVSVANVAPTVTLLGTNTADEGSLHTYTYTVSDPGDEVFTLDASTCGTNGNLTNSSFTAADGSGSFECTFPDGPASSTVSVTVGDGTDSDSDSITVAVANVAPTVVLNGANSANEGQTKTYTYTVSDPGNDPSPTITEDCGTNGNYTNTAAANSFDCTFPDGPASSTVKVTANDGDPTNNIGSDQIGVTVNNVAPTVVLSGPTSAAEGDSSNSYTYTVSDPGNDPNPTITESCGSGNVRTDTAAANDFKCTFADGPGTSTVKVTANDNDASNNIGMDSKDVSVSNVAPTASNGNFVFDPVLGTATASFKFADAGWLDTHANSFFTWSTGSAGTKTVTEENVFPDATGTATETRLFLSGCYNLTVTGTAKDNNGATSAPLSIFSGSTTAVYANGFRPPIMDNERNIVKYGNVVPVKVLLTNPCTGASVTNVSLYITTVQGAGSEIIESTNTVAESVSSADTGSQMRIADGMYIYNLATKSLTQNKDYTVRVRLGAVDGPVILAAVLQPKK